MTPGPGDLQRLYAALFEHADDGTLRAPADGGPPRVSPAACRTPGETEERSRAADAASLHAAVLAHLTDAVIACDPAGAITLWSAGAARTFGWSAAEALGAAFTDLLQPVFLGRRADEALAEVAAAGLPWFEGAQLRKDGARVVVEGSGLPLRSGDGAFAGTVYIERDVSEKKRAEHTQRQLEERLLLSDRLASVGTLAAGVAHEINNPLSYLLANLSFITQRIRGGGDAELEGALEDCLDGARRIGEIVSGLRTFAAARPGARGPVDVARAAAAAARLVDRQVRSRAALEVSLADVPPVNATEPEVAQLVVNLLVNAAQAVPEAAPEGHHVALRVFVAEGRVAIEVRDDGRGIPADLVPHVFDPFFTTRPEGHGTGLGLAACHGIVRALGGEIRVESAVGRGSTFTVLLPAAPARVP